MSINKGSFLKISMVGIGNLLNAALGFIFLTAAAKVLNLDSFGKYAILTSLLTLCSRILDFGTNSLFVSLDKLNSKVFLYSKIFLMAFALPASFILLRLFGIFQSRIILIFLVGLLAYGFNFTFYAYYQKAQRYLEVILINGIPSVIKAIFAIFIFTGRMQIDLNSSFAIFTYSIFGCLLVYFLFPFNFANGDMQERVNFGKILRFIKQAVSPGTSQLIYESWLTLNNGLAKAFNTFSDVGVFSMANKISNIFFLMSFSIFTVLLPKNVERKTKNKGYDFYETLVLGVVVLLMSIMAIAVSQIFLGRVFGTKFKGSLEFLDLLIFASAVSAIQNFVENYFYVNHQTKYLLRINLTKVLILVAVAIYGIPVFGLLSLAVANFVAATSGLLITYVLITQLEKARA